MKHSKIEGIDMEAVKQTSTMVEQYKSNTSFYVMHAIAISRRCTILRLMKKFETEIYVWTSILYKQLQISSILSVAVVGARFRS